MKFIPHILVFVFIIGCQPKTSNIALNDTDLDYAKELFDQINSNLIGQKVAKEVSLVGAKEELTITVDSALIKSDLTILGNKDINKIFLNGGYTKTNGETVVSFERKETENHGPIFFTIDHPKDNMVVISLLEKDENILFQSEVLSLYTFVNDRLKKYQIKGQQDIFGKDHSEYTVTGKILK